MKSLVVFTAVIVLQVAGQQTDVIDDVYECQLYRQCKNCFTLEYCVKFWWSIQRWWIACPVWAPHCNPYSQRCEANPIAECAKLLPTTTAKTTSAVSTTLSKTTAASTTAATTTAASTTDAGTTAASTTAAGTTAASTTTK